MKNKICVVLSLFAALFCFAQNANAGLVFGDGTAQIGYGQQYEGTVGYVTGTNSGGTNFFRQSVTMLDSHWGITSAHGLLEVDTDLSSMYSNLAVGLGTNMFTSPGEVLGVTQAFINPNYQVDNGYDVALLYFDNPFATANPVSIFTGDIQVGMESDIAGFGRLQQVNDFNLTLTGDLRAGNNVIDEVPYTFLGPDYVSTRLRSSSFSNYRPLGMGGTSGDSGGGLFINGEIAAVTAFQAANPFSGAFTGYNVITPGINSWISETRGTTAVPEPSSIILFAIGGTVAALRRRKKSQTI